MAADEALVIDRLDQPALGRADVGHRAIAPGGRQRGPDLSGQRAPRPAGEADLGSREGLLDRPRRAVDRAQAARPLEPLRAAPEADHLRALEPLASGEAARASGPPPAED